jgi:ABC-type amino acid transport substrate-binding protein
MGMFDGEVSRIGNLHSSYPNLNAVPTAINMINVIALGKHSSEKVDKIKDIGHDVVCVKGVKLVKKLVEDTKIQCTFVVNINQALSMVALGRVKYTLLPETNALKALLTEPFENVKIVSPVLYSEKLYHYLHKNNLNIVEPLDKVLRKMQKNGDIDQIRTRFLENIL